MHLYNYLYNHWYIFCFLKINDPINVEIFRVNPLCQKFPIKKKILIIFSETKITEQVIMEDREERKRTDRTEEPAKVF